MVVRVPETRTPPTRREAARQVPAPLRTRVPLGRRRRARRTRALVFIGGALCILFILVEMVLWQPWFRVQTVEAQGAESDQVKAFVEKELVGTRYLVLPKNSIFFIPEAAIRARVLAAFPEAEAVSIAPSGLNTLKVVTSERASVLWWCGTAPDAPVTPCYQTDASGLVFAQVPPEEAAATTSMLSLYAPLAQSVGASPVGNSLAKPAQLPALIQFVKAMRTLGADVVSVTIRGDEADLYTRAGTRITYVLGREQQAAALATSAFPTLNLNDGSLLYVDLRFDSKVFFKKK
jgi:cell division septal protein FtsQ